MIPFRIRFGKMLWLHRHNTHSRDSIFCALVVGSDCHCTASQLLVSLCHFSHSSQLFALWLCMSKRWMLAYLLGSFDSQCGVCMLHPLFNSTLPNALCNNVIILQMKCKTMKPYKHLSFHNYFQWLNRQKYYTHITVVFKADDSDCNHKKYT